MNPNANVDSVMALIRAAQQQGVPANFTPSQMRKAAGWTTGLGITQYDLQRPALALYPWMAELTPMRNTLNRTKGTGDLVTRWRAITGINTKNLPVGVSEGNRNAALTTSAITQTATYAGLGFEDFVTFEERYAAEGYDDARARAVEGTLRAVMLAEEAMILGGNLSTSFGTSPTPTGVGSATGGALANGTYYVGCVALTYQGWQNATVAGGVVQSTSRTNVDASTDTVPGGTFAPSAQSASVSLSAGTSVQSINASVTATTGAVAYAWYLGSSAAHLYLQQITALNSVNFNTALVTTTQDFVTLAATDFTALTSGTGQYTFDGMLYQSAFKAGSGAYLKALATGVNGTGTKLTSDSAGGIVEIDAALAAFFATWKTTPDEIWCSVGHVQDISKNVIGNGGAPLIRFTSDAANGNVLPITGGQGVISNYLSKVTQRTLKVNPHPYLPDGVIMFRRAQNPYPMSGIGNCDEIRCRQDYYQIDWPQRTRKDEYGVYTDETYVNYIPGLFGAITNVARG